MLYLGRKRIASGGGTTTVTAHQFTNNASDIKPDGASASLGVLDTIVRADHVHPYTLASTSEFGVVKIAQGRGLDFLSDGGLYVDVAGDAQITNRTAGRPIAAGSLNFAVKSALTDTNHLTMTSAEQATAQSVLGLPDYAQIMFNVNSEDIATKTYTTIEEFYQYFVSNKTKTFHCGVGAADNYNFKTLVGTPSGFGNYAKANIRVNYKEGNIIEIIAYDYYNNHVATGYIVKRASAADAFFTGWTVLI